MASRGRSRDASRWTIRPSAAVRAPRVQDLRRDKETTMAERELIDTGKDKRYIRRDKRGRFTQSDDVGRSLSSDRRQRAEHESPKGQGDRGDRRSA
jgi:hypothetical protein